MDQKWEAWLNDISDDVCIVTLETTEAHILFEIDNVQYKLIVGISANDETKPWSLDVVDQSKLGDENRQTFLNDVNEAFQGLDTETEPCTTFFAIVLVKYNEILNCDADGFGDDDEDGVDEWEEGIDEEDDSSMQEATAERQVLYDLGLRNDYTPLNDRTV